jgi:hypothetical protein
MLLFSCLSRKSSSRVFFQFLSRKNLIQQKNYCQIFLPLHRRRPNRVNTTTLQKQSQPREKCPRKKLNTSFFSVEQEDGEKKKRKEKRREIRQKKTLGGKNKRHYTPHKTPSLVSSSRFLFFFCFDGGKTKDGYKTLALKRKRPMITFSTFDTHKKARRETGADCGNKRQLATAREQIEVRCNPRWIVHSAGNRPGRDGNAVLVSVSLAGQLL